MAITTAKELVSACLNVARNHKTLYVMGCFGAPMNPQNKQRYCNNHSFNVQPERTEKIMAVSEDTFGFDCVCFIKGLLWGWSGDTHSPYGGAVYGSNGVPDISADQMITVCTDVSDDFSSIVPGELVWQPGHVGVYIGNGKAVEATDAEADGVQIQAVLPMGSIDGLPATGWVKHGKLPWIRYNTEHRTLYRVTADGLDYDAASELASKLNQAGFTAVMEVCNDSPVPETAWTPAEGDTVQFNGKTHYTNANAEHGKPCLSGRATITRIAPGAKHPYHLIRTGNSGPYGWVDADAITKV